MKKYYIPGMISIILLPLMCMWYFSYRGFLVPSTGMEVYVENKGEIEGCDFDERYIPFKGIEFNSYQFSGNQDYDGQLVLNARDRIKELISTKDSLHGVKFMLNDGPDYAHYIEVLNLLKDSKGMVMIYPDSIKYVNRYYSEDGYGAFFRDSEEYIYFLSEDDNTIQEEASSNLSNIIELIGNYKYFLIASFLLLVVFAFRDYIPINKYREKK